MKIALFIAPKGGLACPASLDIIQGMKQVTPKTQRKIRNPKIRGLTLADYFWQRVAKAAPDECWLWTGCVRKNRRKENYGWAYHNDAYGEGAHRVAWRVTNGPIPADCVVRHTCDNPPCVNPAHLLLGTPAENVADRVSRNRHVPIPRDRNKKTKVPTDLLPQLRKEFDALPRNPDGRIRHGFLKPLAAKYGLTPDHLSRLGRFL